MANKISRFFCSLQFVNRLFISICIAIVLFISINTFLWSEYKAEWNTAVKNYEAEIKARDKEIVRIKAETKASEEKKVQEAEMCKKYLKEHNLTAALSECYVARNSITPEISTPYLPIKVEPFYRYTFEEHLAPVAGYSIVFAIALFILLSIISQYHHENSYGWKRLSLVLSVPISVFIGFYYFDFYYGDPSKPFNVGIAIISYPLSLLALLYAKVIYGWIKDGFTTDRGSSSSTVMQSPIIANQSIQEQENLPEMDTLQEAARASTTLQSSKLNIYQDSVERKELIKSITQFMLRLYRGEVPLVYTYWVFGVVVGNVVPLILLGFLSIVNEPPLFILIISIIASVAWMWFISVAIWRSATNYNNNVKQGSICADLAKASVFIGVGTIVVKIIFGILNRMH